MPSQILNLQFEPETIPFCIRARTMMRPFAMLIPLLPAMALVTAMSFPGTARSQDDTKLPDDLDQLIQIKTQLLQEFAEFQKSGPEDKAVQILRKIVNIHRKALQVAQDTQRSRDLIIQLRNVFGNDGEYLSDELFRRREYAESAALRKELEVLFNDALGAEHASAKLMHWKAVAAERLNEAPRTKQVAFSVATGAEPQGAQAMQSGQYDVAAEIFSQLVDAQVATIGESHPFVASALNEYGQALWMQKEFDEAEAVYKRSLKAREETMGKDLQFAATSFNLGRVYQDLQKFADAEQAYQASAAIEESLLGKTHKSFLQTLQQLANLYEIAGENEKLALIQQRISAADPLATVVSHLPKGTIAAASVLPSLMPSDPGLKMMPFEVIQAAGQQQLGMNPLDVDAFVAFSTLPIGDPLFNFGFLFKMRDGAVSDFPWLRPENGEEIEVGEGLRYWKQSSKASDAMCSAQLADGTIVVGTEEGVRQSLTNAGGSSVGSMLLETRNNGHIVAAANTEIIRAFVMAGLQAAPPAPPAIEGLKSLPAEIDSVQAWVNLSQGFKFAVVLNTTDEDAAARTSAALAEALAFGQQMAMQQISQNMSGDDPMQRATLAYVQRVANEYFGQVQPKVAGTSVSIDTSLIDPSLVSGPVAIAFLLPAVQQAREAARRTQDRNSLKMIGLAMQNYHDTFGKFPARASYDKSGKPLLSWRVHLLPYLEQKELYEQFHLDEPWDSEHNLPLVQQMPDVYQSKSFGDSEKTIFVTFDGDGTMMDGNAGISLRDVTDGTSNTLFVVEANPEHAVVWTQPQDLPFDAENPKNGLGKIRLTGFQALFVDGSVELIAIDIDGAMLKNMIIRNDGNNPGRF